MTAHLLPPNATAPEALVSQAIGARVEAIGAPLRPLLNPATCPLDLLPWLAQTFSVDYWDPEWTEETKRAVVAASIDLHRHKGTASPLIAALTRYGFATRSVVENAMANGAYLADGERLADSQQLRRADGSLSATGTRWANQVNGWAMYSLRMDRAITNREAMTIRRIADWTAPTRCHLTLMDFAIDAIPLADGEWLADGTHRSWYTSLCPPANGSLAAIGRLNAGYAHGLFDRNL